MNARVWLTAVILAGAACGDDARFAKPAAEMDAREEPAKAVTAERVMNRVVGVAGSESQTESQTVRLPSQMIIRTGQVSIEVDSLEQAVRQVTELATKAGGYVANSSISTGENAPRTATIELKIPADRYDGTLGGLKQVGTIRSAATNSQDVGEEFVDVTARVTNAKRLEERLLTLLATRTGKLEDVLNVERELARVREEIERYEGRLRYLKAQVSMSTLSVTVFEPGPLVGGPGENVIVTAFRESWRNFVGVVAGAIALAGGFLPLAILGGLGYLLARRWWKRLKHAPPAA